MASLKDLQISIHRNIACLINTKIIDLQVFQAKILWLHPVLTLGMEIIILKPYPGCFLLLIREVFLYSFKKIAYLFLASLQIISILKRHPSMMDFYASR
jgi:hypothetical protein